jgi:threonine aldolase
MGTREFRSDTMTRPAAAMRDAMRDAEVGDDVCGEDPTANRLQAMAAELLGTEAALFVPSGTFGNQCAIAVHTRPGDEVILAEATHVIDHEAGAAAALSGVQTRTVLPARDSWPTAADIASRLRTVPDLHHPETGLIVLENALADGTVMPLDAMAAVAELARAHRVPVHLDGARLFNAAAALGAPVQAIARHCDSVTFCLSKGLGAPVGSLLCGTASFIERARRRRKIMGGGMRQVGVLCAAGIVALRDGPAQLMRDHANASLLAELLASIPGIVIDLARVQTNIVFIRVRAGGAKWSEQGLVDFLNARGFAVYPPHWMGVRFVTSREVDEADVRALAGAVAAYMEL